MIRSHSAGDVACAGLPVDAEKGVVIRVWQALDASSPYHPMRGPQRLTVDPQLVTHNLLAPETSAQNRLFVMPLAESNFASPVP
jgi:hypothetical protein